MNESTLLKLKVIVERAVRPVKATLASEAKDAGRITRSRDYRV